MKKIFALCTAVFAGFWSFGQTATWNGSVSDSWNNPANWTWSNSSSGIPGPTTDVVIDAAANLAPVLQSTDSVNCRNIFLGAGLTMNNFSVLNIFGDSVALTANANPGAAITGIDLAGGSSGQQAKINFRGNTDKVINGVEVIIGKINIACNSLKVENDGRLIIQTAIRFDQPAVPVGNAVSGNLIIDATGQCIISPQTSFQFNTFTPGIQIPPHIIATTNITPTADLYGMVIILDFLNISGLNGAMTLPMGPTAKSYTPVSINHTGDYPWCVSIYKGLPNTCTNTVVDNNNAVQYVYNIFPVDLVQEMLAVTLDTPAAISLDFNRASVGEDVPSGFNTNNDPLKIYRMDFAGCHHVLAQSVETSATGSQQVRMHIAQQDSFGYFIIAPGAGPSSIRPNKEQLAMELFPNPASEHCNIRMQAGHPAAELKLINTLGQTLWSQSFAPNVLQQGYAIPLKTLPKGIYYLQVYADHAYSSQKIVKQ